METTSLSSAHPDLLRRKAVLLEYLTIGWNVVEAVVAIAAGWLAGSIALVGFGLDSVIETIAGVALLWRLRQRGDFEETAESLARKIVSVTFFVLAAYVGYESLAHLWRRETPKESLTGIALATVSLIVMPILGRAKRKLAVQMNSRALAADGMETILCAWLSASLLAGLLLNALLGWWWADPVAALIMCGFMVHEGLEAWEEEDED
jgi:divalent metal cation (Fe/Co/Zn/Cd) transporter